MENSSAKFSYRSSNQDVNDKSCGPRRSQEKIGKHDETKTSKDTISKKKKKESNRYTASPRNSNKTPSWISYGQQTDGAVSRISANRRVVQVSGQVRPPPPDVTFGRSRLLVLVVSHHISSRWWYENEDDVT